MVFYYALRTLAIYINGVRSDIFGMAVAVRNVWLIGDNLYAWFASISARMGVLVSYVYQLAENWLTVYHQLQSIVPEIPGLSQILYYLDDLIGLIVDFAYHVGQAIRQRYPALYNFNLDPVSYILETIYRYTGLSYDFVHNPQATISRLIDNALGDVRNLLLNPYVYIVNKLTLGNPLLQLLLLQPDLWLRREINILFPDWQRFIANPVEYILETFISGLETFLARYQTRLVKLAETVLNKIF